MKHAKSTTTPPMTDEEYSRRCSDDFRFMTLCGFKGNMAMYYALRDRTLAAEQARRAELSKKEGA